MARRRAAEEAARKGEQSGQPAAKKKRKRKVRYPKGFDPANPGPPPNPERWLPKWQRSDFKKKRNRRKEKVCPQVAGHKRSRPVSRALLGTSGCYKQQSCACAHGMLRLYQQPSTNVREKFASGLQLS